MDGSFNQEMLGRHFFCLFCQKPTAIPVKDIRRFNEHMLEGHNVFQDHAVLLALHFTTVRENEEVIERVRNEMNQHVEIKEDSETTNDNLLRKVLKLEKCLFCKDVTDKGIFTKHLSFVHRIFFGHELLVASKLLTLGEKEVLIKRVQNKA